jgi:hypothetical protein
MDREVWKGQSPCRVHFDVAGRSFHVHLDAFRHAFGRGKERLLLVIVSRSFEHEQASSLIFHHALHHALLVPPSCSYLSDGTSVISVPLASVPSIPFSLPTQTSIEIDSLYEGIDFCTLLPSSCPLCQDLIRSTLGPVVTYRSVTRRHSAVSRHVAL